MRKRLACSILIEITSIKEGALLQKGDASPFLKEGAQKTKRGTAPRYDTSVKALKEDGFKLSQIFENNLRQELHVYAAMC